MTSALAALALLVALGTGTAAAAPADEARRAYERFAAAQNARDLGTVSEVLLDSPRLLWVSDGMSIWGRDKVLQRMSLFQEASVWRVAPDLDKSVAVELGAGAAYLHLPLALTIGSAGAPETLRFLVSVLCVATENGWRIAALFTTSEKPN
jgi:ketosteroid isomerase-like protein